MTEMLAHAPLWLAAISLPVLIASLLAAGALLLCRYDQRHGRDIDVTLGRRSMRYRSRPHEPATRGDLAGPGNLHALPARRRTPGEEHDAPTAPPGTPARRRAA